MQDGRLIFTTEKRAPGFYQLALRRQNLDGGDYHPLYAQRGTHRLRAGDGRRRARRQELRHHLQQPRRRARRGRARCLQPIDRGRLHEHDRERLPRRSERHQPDHRQPLPRAISSSTRSTIVADRRLLHEPVAPAGRQDARQLRYRGARDLRRRLRRLRARSDHRAPRRSSSAARARPRSRPWRYTRATDKGHLRLGSATSRTDTRPSRPAPCRP